MKIYNHTKTYINVIITLYLTGKKVEATQISIDNWWIDKQNEYYLAIKQKEVLMHTITW